VTIDLENIYQIYDGSGKSLNDIATDPDCGYGKTGYIIGNPRHFEKNTPMDKCPFLR